MITICWRNIWRNKTRSLVILIAIALGTIGGLWGGAFMEALIYQRVNNSLTYETASIYINDSVFIDDPQTSNYMPEARSWIEKLSQLPEVEAVSPRWVVEGMIATARKNTAIKLIAVEPELEKQVIATQDKIADTLGSFFEQGKSRRIIIGAKLADKLKISVGSRLTFQFVNAQAEQVAYNFKVGGIFRVGNSMFEEQTAYIRMSDIAPWIAMPKGALHEIAIRISDPFRANSVAQHIARQIPAQNIKVRDWLQIDKLTAINLQSFDLYALISMIVIYGALGFGILNTMLMAILERTRELGMLKALGMTCKKVFIMVIYESIILTLLGAVIGVILSMILISVTGNIGIDLAGFADGMEAWGFSTVIYPTLSTKVYFQLAVVVCFTGILSALYPALKAVKIKPAEAIKEF